MLINTFSFVGPMQINVIRFYAEPSRRWFRRCFSHAIGHEALSSI